MVEEVDEGWGKEVDPLMGEKERRFVRVEGIRRFLLTGKKKRRVERVEKMKRLL